MAKIEHEKHSDTWNVPLDRDSSFLKTWVTRNDIWVIQAFPLQSSQEKNDRINGENTTPRTCSLYLFTPRTSVTCLPRHVTLFHGALPEIAHNHAARCAGLKRPPKKRHLQDPKSELSAALNDLLWADIPAGSCNDQRKADHIGWFRLGGHYGSRLGLLNHTPKLGPLFQ